jgi:hypothetical protein
MNEATTFLLLKVLNERAPRPNAQRLSVMMLSSAVGAPPQHVRAYA